MADSKTVMIYIEAEVLGDPAEFIARAYDEIPREFSIVGQSINGEAVDEEGDPL